MRRIAYGGDRVKRRNVSPRPFAPVISALMRSNFAHNARSAENDPWPRNWRGKTNSGRLEGWTVLWAVAA